MKQPELARSGKGQSPPVQPVVQPPRDTILAALTPRELDAIRTVCRDSDSEQAVRMLSAALARAGK